jgi:UDP-glucose 4-epimerase
MSSPRVLVTGAAGYLGSQLVAGLARATDPARKPAVVVATDVREVPAAKRVPGVEYRACDIRSPEIASAMVEFAIDTVVHLAAIVTPGKKSNREFEYSVDVLGTRNVLEACVAADVESIVVTSSGAAYGYYADNPDWITEDQPVRGNPEFAYSDHKRLVEEMLAEYRAAHPRLKQVVLRVGTILGETTSNQITALFERPRLLVVKGSPSPFVFIWDQDVVGAIEHAIFSGRSGIFNVAGDGALTVPEIAERLGKRCLVLPAWLLQAALFVLKGLGLSQYGPEQVNFLRYRPVLDNRRLKEEFGYMPRKTSSEAFEVWRAAAAMRGTRP